MKVHQQSAWCIVMSLSIFKTMYREWLKQAAMKCKLELCSTYATYLSIHCLGSKTKFAIIICSGSYTYHPSGCPLKVKVLPLQELLPLLIWSCAFKCFASSTKPILAADLPFFSIWQPDLDLHMISLTLRSAHE